MFVAGGPCSAVFGLGLAALPAARRWVPVGCVSHLLGSALVVARVVRSLGHGTATSVGAVHTTDELATAYLCRTWDVWIVTVRSRTVLAACCGAHVAVSDP